MECPIELVFVCSFPEYLLWAYCLGGWLWPYGPYMAKIAKMVHMAMTIGLTNMSVMGILGKSTQIMTQLQIANSEIRIALLNIPKPDGILGTMVPKDV